MMLEEGIYKAFNGSSMEEPKFIQATQSSPVSTIKALKFHFLSNYRVEKYILRELKIFCVGCVQEYETLLPHGFFVNDFLVDPPRA